jgi:hypothetical protein
MVTHGREQDAAVGIRRIRFGLAAPDDDVDEPAAPCLPVLWR